MQIRVDFLLTSGVSSMKGMGKGSNCSKPSVEGTENSPVLFPQDLTKEKSLRLERRLLRQELEHTQSFPHAMPDSPKETKHV